MYNKSELQYALAAAFDEFAEFINCLSPKQYLEMSAGKWSAGQQLDHLIRAARPVNMAMRLPKFLPRLLFGKPNRVGYTYNEVIKKYQHKLQEGAKASGPYIPPIAELNKKEKILANFLRQKDNLLSVLAKWSEGDLDAYLLPHPIVGKLTVREMLFFTVYHIRHHLSSLKSEKLQ